MSLSVVQLVACSHTQPVIGWHILSLPLIGWHSCLLSVSIPALPPAQASTLHMLSSILLVGLTGTNLPSHFLQKTKSVEGTSRHFFPVLNPEHLNIVKHRLHVCSGAGARRACSLDTGQLLLPWWPGLARARLPAQLFRGLEAGRGQRYIIHYKLYTAYHYRTHYQLFRLYSDFTFY